MVRFELTTSGFQNQYSNQTELHPVFWWRIAGSNRSFKNANLVCPQQHLFPYNDEKVNLLGQDSNLRTVLPNTSD